MDKKNKQQRKGVGGEGDNNIKRMKKEGRQETNEQTEMKAEKDTDRHNQTDRLINRQRGRQSGIKVDDINRLIAL